jgi:uncharacterized membrane protein HdeD (DUF308 family)
VTAVAAKPAQMPWWVLLLEGIAAIILGGLMWMNPLKTANALVFFIAIYWLVAGVISIVRIFFDRRRWGWNLFMGIIGILAGYVLLDAGAVGRTFAFGWTIVIILGIQGLIMGIISLIEAFQGGGWGPGIIGALSIIFGLLLLGNSVAATMVLPWVLGVFMVVGGIFAIIMAFRLRSATS